MTPHLTHKQAALLLSIHPNTLKRWREAGEIQGMRMTPRSPWRYAESEVKRLLGGKSQPQTN